MATVTAGEEQEAQVGRLSAQEMDEKRRAQLAYQYLCHLEETRLWLEACIGESLPPAGELETCLQNGVTLAKLASVFAPRIVSRRAIFDANQERYLARGLEFRHTDNINYFLRALLHLGLPRNYWPETTDIYDGRNMPKLVYCLHALSAFLFRSGRAARIEDLYGKVTFSDAEISAATRNINADQISKFRSIGDDILGEENKENLPENGAVTQVDFRSIEEAMRLGQADRLAHLLASQCPALPVRMECARHYLAALQALRRQHQHQQQQHLSGSVKSSPVPSPRSPGGGASVTTPASLDLAALTRCVAKGNRSWEREKDSADTVSAINAALAQSVTTAGVDVAASALAALLCRRAAGVPALLWGGDPPGQRLYWEELRTARADKGSDLDREELEPLVFVVNKVGQVNQAAQQYVTAEPESEPAVGASLLAALRDASLHFADVTADSVADYAARLTAAQQGVEGQSGRWLTYREIAIRIAEVNRGRLVSTRQLHAAQGQGRGAGAGDAGSGSGAVGGGGGVLRAIRALNAALLNSDADNEDDDHGNEESNSVQDLLDLLAAALRLAEPLNPEVGELCLVMLRDRLAQQFGQRDLWLQDVQECADAAGVMTEAARGLVACLLRLDAALLANGGDDDDDDSSRGAALTALADPRMALGVPVIRALAGAYLHRLRALREFKAKEVLPAAGCGGGSEGQSPQSGALLIRWSGGRPFSLHLPEGRIRWRSEARQRGGGGGGACAVPPQQPAAALLTLGEVEEAVRRENEAFRDSRIRETSLPFLVSFQAAVRGCLTRRRLLERRRLFRASIGQVVAIQRWWRGRAAARRREAGLERFRRGDQLSIVVRLQARVRMLLTRRAYLAELARYRALERRAIRIQSWWRGCRVRRQYRRLCDPDAGPVTLASLRPFLRAAEHSWADYHQEIELLRVRAEIVEEIRQCQKVERQLQEMDVKIGLLVRNRLSLQEVVRHSHRLLGDRGGNSGGGGNGGTSDATVAGAKPTRQQVEKETKKIELYQQLVHLVQTQPTYLASLVQLTPDTLPLLQLFNYLEGDREQYLYMRLFCLAVPQELARLYRPAELLSPTPGLAKLLSGMVKAGQTCLSALLRPLVGQCLRDGGLCVNSSPIEVYSQWLAEKETVSGNPAGLPYQVTAEQALEQPEVRARLDANVRALRQTAGQFVRALTQCRLPYSVRLAAKCVRQCLVPLLAAANSACPEKDALKLTCQLVITRFISPMLVSPESHDLIDDAGLLPLSPEQRRTLGSLAKMLQLAAANKGFGTESCAHLHCLNHSLRDWHQTLRDLLLTECRETAEPGVEFDMDEYSEMARLTVPTLHIAAEDLQALHLDLLELRAATAATPDSSTSNSPAAADPLIEILDELERSADGARPLMTAAAFASSASQSQSQSRVTLHLAPRHDPLDTDYLSEATGPATLALRTKRLLVDILLSCHGNNSQHHQQLTEILRSPSSPGEERRHELLLKSRERLERQVRAGTGWRSRSSLKEAALPLDVKKARVLEAVGRLGEAGREDRLLRDLADDIRQWRGKRARRRQELARLYATRQRLAWKRRFQEEQADYYTRYCQACVRGQHTLARSGGNAPSPGSAAAQQSPRHRHQRGGAAAVKYTAAELHKRGVVQEIDGLSCGQYKNLQFEVTEIGDGVFEVVARFMGVLMDRVEITLQELLRLQFEGAATMHVFNRARVNVNLLLHLINKKFYYSRAK